MIVNAQRTQRDRMGTRCTCSPSERTSITRRAVPASSRLRPRCMPTEIDVAPPASLIDSIALSTTFLGGILRGKGSAGLGGERGELCEVVLRAVVLVSGEWSQGRGVTVELDNADVREILAEHELVGQLVREGLQVADLAPH